MERIKALFVHKHDDDSFEIESMWCLRKEEDNYALDNIPFIVKNIALGDIFTVEFDKNEQSYYFDKFVTVSGNSTIRVYFEDESHIQETRDKLVSFKCESEGFLSRKMIAVNIPADVDYKPVKDFLDMGEANKQWGYEESCLCHKV